MLTDKQRAILCRPINPIRVLVAQGQSHLPAYDVEAHLTRIFGFEGWDRKMTDLWLISEEREHYKGKAGEDKQGWTVTYGCRLTLILRDPHGNTVKEVDGCATGSANHLPLKGDAHDFAMKNADSYALKRCAKALGDQFGLSLYNKGSLQGLIQAPVAYDGEEQTEIPEPRSMGNDERQADEHTGEIEEKPKTEEKGANQSQIIKLRAALRHIGIVDNDDVHQWAGAKLLLQVDSLKLLSSTQISKLITEASEGATA
jgi:recombination DNA repair RAD52 pathway protein